MKKLRKDDRESNRWHAASAVCLIIGLTAALLYALPYIVDVGKIIEDPSHKAKLFFFALTAALVLPLIAVWIRMGLEVAETESTEETIYAY